MDKLDLITFSTQKGHIRQPQPCWYVMIPNIADFLRKLSNLGSVANMHHEKQLSFMHHHYMNCSFPCNPSRGPKNKTNSLRPKWVNQIIQTQLKMDAKWDDPNWKTDSNPNWKTDSKPNFCWKIYFRYVHKDFKKKWLGLMLPSLIMVHQSWQQLDHRMMYMLGCRITEHQQLKYWSK